ncbi:MAG TPA: hypothetical protein VFW44_09120 [Bryobacteraceae bacterium]|nr:hypothetical protein [Bryobacteraceae bacterium]
MKSAPPKGETWWVTAQAMYAERVDTAEFQEGTGKAGIIDPDPGSFLVSVLSSVGYRCIQEIDMVEYTRHWTFDPATCTFQLDAFAHVVTDVDKREKKTTDWYLKMRRQREEIHNAMERLAASPDSN